MSLSRLVTFGCSLTYGHGLPDCFDQPTNGAGIKPSVHAWPQILANKLNWDCKNCSIAGASNKLILKTILDFDFHPNKDFVIVQFSFANRWTIFRKDTWPIHLNAHNKEFFQWFKTTNDYDLYITSAMAIDCAFSHLKSIGCNFIFSCVDDDLEEIKKYIKHAKLPIKSINEFYQDYPKALDTFHPGLECHTVYANYLFNSIKNLIN